MEEVGSDDSDSEHEENEWVERKIADVGSSPSEESSFPHSSSNISSDPSDPSSSSFPEDDTNAHRTDEEMKGEEFGDFASDQQQQES